MQRIEIIEQLDMDLQKLAQKTVPESYRGMELTTCLKDASIKHFYYSGKGSREL